MSLLFGSGTLQAALIATTKKIIAASRNLYSMAMLPKNEGHSINVGDDKWNSPMHDEGGEKSHKQGHSGGKWRTYGGGKKSSILEYEYGPNYLRVKFGGNVPRAIKANKTYQWTAWGLGDDAIAEMIRLAEDGVGLEEYILTNCARKASRIY